MGVTGLEADWLLEEAPRPLAPRPECVPCRFKRDVHVIATSYTAVNRVPVCKACQVLVWDGHLDPNELSNMRHQLGRATRSRGKARAVRTTSTDQRKKREERWRQGFKGSTSGCASSSTGT